MPAIKNVPKTAEIPLAQFISVERKGACDAAVQKTVELPQVQHTERIVHVTVVVPSSSQSFQTHGLRETNNQPI